MNGRAQAQRLIGNIRDLGTRRLAALGLVGIAVLLLVGLGTVYLGRPQQQVLYGGLDRADVSRIGTVLQENGIPFDVSADGATVLVAYGDTPRARMLLAERGLPQGATAGYELFDHLGSFGLTSFMQQITRVRALEGELARTIQTMNGILAARVHIVLPDRGSFRRKEQPASASVVIHAERADETAAAQAIRHLIAAGVPGMTIDHVTVIDTTGTVLASGEDGASAATGRVARLQSDTNRETEESIRRTLAPYLGLGNFTVSVASTLDTDRVTENQTIYDPNSRVERSVRDVRDKTDSQNHSSQAPVTVQQNIPQAQLPKADGTQETESKDHRENLTNYEISSKVVQTVRDGYAIKRLSIAVLVNRAKLLENASAQAGAVPLDQQMKDIEDLVRSAAGYEKSRGDQLTLSAVPFAQGSGDLQPVPGPGLKEVLLRQIGTVINAVVILVVGLALVWFGLRPAMRAILAKPAEATPAVETFAAAEAGFAPELPAGQSATPGRIEKPVDPQLLEDLSANANRMLQRRLDQIIEYDEEQAVALLKQWLIEDERV